MHINLPTLRGLSEVLFVLFIGVSPVSNAQVPTDHDLNLKILFIKIELYLFVSFKFPIQYY